MDDRREKATRMSSYRSCFNIFVRETVASKTNTWLAKKASHEASASFSRYFSIFAFWFTAVPKTNVKDRILIGCLFDNYGLNHAPCLGIT